MIGGSEGGDVCKAGAEIGGDSETNKTLAVWRLVYLGGGGS